MNIDILNANWKTKVTPDQSIEIQSLLFKNGRDWFFPEIGDSLSHKPTLQFLLFTKSRYEEYHTLTQSDCKEFYESASIIEIKAEEIIEALNMIERAKKLSSEIMGKINNIEDIEKPPTKGWVNVEDNLPPPEQEIEVRFYDDNKHDYMIMKSKLSRSSFNYYYFSSIGKYVVEEWRHIKKRKPDFNNLKKGDLIVVEWENDNKENGKQVGFFYKKEPPCIETFQFIYDDGTESRPEPLNIEVIKKITRINLETKTFEEI